MLFFYIFAPIFNLNSMTMKKVLGCIRKADQEFEW